MDSGKRKPRIGIIVESLGKYNSAALRYAILKLNTAQSFAEFEIVYKFPNGHEFFRLTRTGTFQQRKLIESVGKAFEDEILRLHALPWRDRPQTPCDRYLAICNCQLDDGFYLIRLGEKLRGLMVGSWSKQLAPPSLLEFIVDTCIKQGLAEAFGTPPSHISSRGCIFDFNNMLDNTRNGVLIGHICADCEDALAKSRNEKWKEIRNIVGGRWLGDPTDPFSAYCELERLGFRAFKASGVRDSQWQKLIHTLRGQFLQEIIKYIVLGLALYFAFAFGFDGLGAKIAP